MEITHLLIWFIAAGIYPPAETDSIDQSAYRQLAREQRFVWLHGGESYELGSYVDVALDSTNRLTLLDLRQGRLDSAFRASHIDLPPMGYSASSVWMRAVLFNPDTAAQYWYLEYPLSTINTLDFFAPDVNGIYFGQRAGNLIPFDERTIRHRNPVFSVNLQKRQVAVIFLRIHSQNSILTNMTLWTPKAFAEKSRIEYFFLGLFYGTLFVMVFYNLFLFFTVRDVSYLYYVIYISSMLLAQIATNGQAFEFIWPNHPEWNDALLLILIGVVLSSASQFFQIVSQTELLNPWVDKLIIALMTLGLVCILASGFVSARIFIFQAYSVIGITMPVVLLTAGVQALRRGFSPARYYLIAWAAVLVGLAIFSLRDLGIMPLNAVTGNILNVGIVVEMVLLSIGLGARINLVQAELGLERVETERLAHERDQERAQIKESELRARAAETQARSQQAEIENAKKIAAINAELERKNRKLETLNDQMEKTVSIVRALNSAVALNDLLHSILEKTQAITNVKTASILAWDTPTKKYKFKACLGVDIKRLEPIELTADEVLERYVKDGVEIEKDIWVVRQITGRIAQDKFDQFPPLDSLLVVCLRGETQVEGYLLFDNILFSDLEKQDILLLKNLKEHLQWAILKARLLDEFRILNDHKNEYLGIVAHDLRNPLSAVIGYTDMMIADIRSGRAQQEEMLNDLGSVEKVAKQMSAFIGELLDIAAIESGKVRLDRQPGSIADAVRNVAPLNIRRADQKQIKVTAEALDALPRVMMDRLKIESVVDNLLSNAIKYTQAGGSVRVFGEAAKTEIQIHVEDTGLGLTQDDLAKVFSTFTKLSARPTADETSTGLGLAIVKKIIEIHGGRVWVNSEHGKGSIFSFSIPL